MSSFVHVPVCSFVHLFDYLDVSVPLLLNWAICFHVCPPLRLFYLSLYSFCLAICPFVFLFICLFVCALVSMSTCFSVYLSPLSACLFVSLFVCSSLSNLYVCCCLLFRSFLCQLVNLNVIVAFDNYFIVHLSIYWSIVHCQLSVCAFVHLSICLSSIILLSLCQFIILSVCNFTHLSVPPFVPFMEPVVRQPNSEGNGNPGTS